MLFSRKLKGFIKKSSGGRNSYGRITVRNRSGKKDNYYRPLLTEIVPIFIWLKLEIKSIIKDDFRSNFLLEVEIKDSSLHSLIGLKGYTLAFENAYKGQIIEFGPKVPIKTGNRTFLSKIIVGNDVFHLEDSLINSNTIRSRTSFLKTAGSYGTLFYIEKNEVAVRLFKKRKMLKLPISFIGTIGKASNNILKFFNEGTASYNLKRGFTPNVRGVAKNPVDHPHGGGEGKTSGGRKTSVTPWGRLSKGTKTRTKTKKKCEKIVKI
jgi:large subunit ribosomal protein L2